LIFGGNIEFLRGFSFDGDNLGNGGKIAYRNRISRGGNFTIDLQTWLHRN